LFQSFDVADTDTTKINDARGREKTLKGVVSPAGRRGTLYPESDL